MRLRIVESRLNQKIEQFCRDESGGMLIFMVIAFFTMTIFGGLAVDLSNHEQRRTTYQTHLDNAVLAAASLSQQLDPEEVVFSYMSSAGLDPSVVNVETSEENIGSILVGRTVYASLDGGVNTYFFRFFDIDSLGMTIEAQATERVEDIEISLVLDVSGSMRNPTSDRSQRKIDALKQSASDFVDAVLSDAEEGRASISIIPYSTKANAGESLLSYYNATQEHNYSHCVDFDAADYTNLAINPSSRLQRTGHFQFQGASVYRQEQGEWTCRIDDGFSITPLSSSADDLKAQIAKLTPEGSTSIDMGAKWGLALLDPSAQNAVSGLISEGVIDGAFRGRPHEHRAQNNMKVLVLMTDGENDDEFRLHSQYASGQSDVVRSASLSGDEVYYGIDSPEYSYRNDSRYPTGERYFYFVHPTEGNEIWHNYTPKNDPGLSRIAHRIVEKQLSWPELWAEMSPFYYGYNLRGRQEPYSSWRENAMYNLWNRIHWEVSPTEKNTRLRNICIAAEQAGIIVYSIGLEVDKPVSLALLKDCASTEAHYFDVNGTGIQTAFDMIAASISMLRLTK